MKKQKSFFAQMLSGQNGEISSKRFLGSVMLLVLTAAVTVNMFLGEPHEWLGRAIDTLIITAGALVGLGIADKAFMKKTDNNENYGTKNKKPSNEDKTNEEDND